MHSFRRLLITRNSIGMHTRSQSKESSSYALIHSESSQKFHMKINSSEALVEYERDGDVLDLVHSYVPESMRGKGIGEILAKKTFDYIDQYKLKMRVTCPFLHRIYEENKQKYEHLVD